MSWWKRNGKPITLRDLAHSSLGSWAKLVFVGFVVPACMVYLSTKTWLSERAYLPGRRTSGGVWLTGDAARAMAVVHMGIALALHAFGFWEERPNDWWFKTLLSVGTLFIAGGIMTAMVLTLAY